MEKSYRQGILFPEFEVQEEQPQMPKPKKGAKGNAVKVVLQKKRSKVKKLQADLMLKQQEIERLQQENKKMAAKAEAFDCLIGTHSLFPINVIAKSLGYTAIWLNNYLQDKKVQYKRGDIWFLYEKYDKCDYTRVCWYNYSTDSKGNPLTRAHTYWTSKGLMFIRELLKADGLLRE